MDLGSIKEWQSAIGSFLGLVAIFLAATLAYRSNRRRDEYLRLQEIKSIAAALYAEIVGLRLSVARVANMVARRYADHGIGRVRGKAFDKHFFENAPLPPAPIYAGLSAQIGKLPANILLGIVQFQSAYESARYWLPKLQDDDERPYDYSVLHVLNPALKAVTDVQATLREIEQLAGIPLPADMPDIKAAKDIAEFENERFE